MLSLGSHSHERQAEPMTGRKRWGQRTVKTARGDSGEIKVRGNTSGIAAGPPLSTSTHIERVCFPLGYNLEFNS